MMKNKKEKAINLILLGLALKYLPLIAIAIFIENLNNLPYTLFFFISGLFLLGYTSFIKGCSLYAQSKGYSSNRGWIGLLSIFSLLILLLMPVNVKILTTLELSDNKPKNNLFYNINIPELFLLLLIALGVAFVPNLLIIYLSDISNTNFELEETTGINLIIIYFCIIYGFILLIKLQESGLQYTNFINFKTNIDCKLILFFTILTLAFTKSFNSIVLYKLSFIFPGYVEDYLNENNFNNLLEIILWSFLTILLSPVTEGLLFQGIVLQKWSIKWGVRSGILTTSLLSTVIGLDFDIVTLFISSILYSILYFKTRNLLIPILCQVFYNTIITIFDMIDFFSKSTIERELFISASDYQASIQPLLGQIVFMIAITTPLVGYFIYKNFPKNDAILPYADSGS